MILTYAQNLEDVVLQRVFKDVEEGFYIDIGAHHPTADSVSRAFYDRGWRGINVEPVRYYADLLRAERDRDIVIEAVVSNRRGDLPFYAFDGTGLSTLESDIGARHESQGFEAREIVVSSVTLDDIFQLAGDRDVHWMKIDVEGHEKQVLEGWTVPVKPWVLVIESTLPLSTVESSRKWEPILRKLGYKAVYFDGLNRFFVRRDRSDQLSGRWLPPNIFDDMAYANEEAPALRVVQERRVHEAGHAQGLIDQAVARAEAAEAELAESNSRLEEARAVVADTQAHLEAERAAFEARLSEQAEARTIYRTWLAAERAVFAEKVSKVQTGCQRISADVDNLKESVGAAICETRRLNKLLVSSRGGRAIGIAFEGKHYANCAEDLRQAAKVATTFAGQSMATGAIAEKQSLAQERNGQDEGAMMADKHVKTIRDAFTSVKLLKSVQGDEAFVEVAYLVLLRRIPDEVGRRHYLDKLERGGSRSAVIVDLALSREARLQRTSIGGLRTAVALHKARRSMLFGAQFVSNPKQNIPSLTASGPVLPGSTPIAAELNSGSETQFIHSVYTKFLGREPDQAGRNHYLRRLENGVDERFVLAEIYWSAEAMAARDRGMVQPVPGILRFLWLPRMLSTPYVGPVFRAIYSLADARARQFRALNRTISRSASAVAVHLEEIEQRLASVSSDLKGVAENVNVRNQLSEVCPEKFAANTLGGMSGHQPVLLEQICPEPSRRVIYYYVDHTTNCPTNTGLQRLVRQLARAFIETEVVVRFIKWNSENKKFVYVNKEELDHLAKWSGPTLSEDERLIYPEVGGQEVEVDASKMSPIDWLLVPEVTHVTFHQSQPTLDVIIAAKNLRIKIAFIYYDAIPLRLQEYAGGAAAHEKYMQALILADLIIPISRRSAEEIRSFFKQHQLASYLPSIIPVHLPGESMISPRVQYLAPFEAKKMILSVGSIEPRKNQLKLIEAFDAFSKTQEGDGWHLVLAGHLRADVADSVNAAIGRNNRISYVPHPLDTDLDELYRSAAFTVFPSTEEGFGLPILESLWYGIPCICANFGAMAEVAEGGGCAMVDTRDVNAITAAIRRLATNPAELEALSSAAVKRNMGSWSDYGRSIKQLLDSESDQAARLESAYFWVDDTCRNPHNSGIQRVVRQLAKAFMEGGLRLVPVVWAGCELRPASREELEHLAKWNGPSADAWAPWAKPTDSGRPDWVIVPELVHGKLGDVRSYSEGFGIRCAAIFYDAIPFKMRDTFGIEFADNHAAYMRELNFFDKVFSISRFSHEDLKRFLREDRVRTHSFDHRFQVLNCLGPLSSVPRTQEVKSPNSTVNILSVISIEPRKNPLILLKAFEAASRRAKVRISLTIVGRRIRYFDNLANQLEECELNNSNITWLQDIDDDSLDNLYCVCDFTVFPSLEEGYGLPIVESLWRGRPCIIHDGGAMAEVAVGGGCLAIDMGQVDALADALLTMAENASLRLTLAEQATRRHIGTWRESAQFIRANLAEDRLGDGMISSSSVEGREIYQELPNIKKRPLLSVCISTYNRGGWLSLNLRNLFDQVPVPSAEVEFLVVDNASSDDTEDMVKPYLGRPDFRFVRNIKNVGMLGNLTVTAHEARGEYVWILGDDDLVKEGGIKKVLDIIQENRGVSLIYPNYAYTHEKSPDNVGKDIQGFLEGCPTLIPSSPDFVGKICEVADKNENLFTAIYCLIFRRDHALRAYSQDTSGRPFSSMRTSIPTTYYVLNYMMAEDAYWVGDPLLVVNFNVSWNKYAALQILERVPEAQDLAERMGADPGGMDRWRENLLPGFVHYWREMFENDEAGNSEHFSPERVVFRMKHLEGFANIASDLAEIYDKAYTQGHPAAHLPTERLFGAFIEEGL